MPARKTEHADLSALPLLQREVNLLFQRLAEFGRLEPTAEGEWAPPVDVYESRGRLVLVVEVPGLAPEALRVVYRDRQVVIRGERRAPRTSGVSFVCLERPHGRFERRIPIDVAVDIRRAEARLDRGLLVISIPHLQDRRGTETEIPIERQGEP